jgi:hypothetical protein
MIAGAAAQIAFERTRKVFASLIAQACRRQDHARGAKSALKAGGIDESLLHRMQFPVLREALDGGDLLVVGSESWDQTAMNGVQTVHAPQSPASHPFLTPNHPSSRRKVRRHWPGFAFSENVLPLTK